ncbi:MAG: hypothetical protein KGI37_04405 [Alphaproteobacteria bacterium]|nr:hypothetical protein [Alphaproteobacteria bacterium]
MNFRDLLPALCLLIGSTAILGWMEYRPQYTGSPVFAVFSPFLTADQTRRIAENIGANIVTESRFPFALIVQSDAPYFSRRLHEAGAWMVLDASGRGNCMAMRPPNL